MIAVFGLGPIGAGSGMALVRAGFPVVGIDPDPARAGAWRERTGAPAVTGPDALTAQDWQEVELVLVAVRLAEQLEPVLSALPVRADAPLPVLVLSTLAVSEARRLADVPGLRMVEAPVSGGVWAAEAGSLTVFVHAPPGTVDIETAVLRALCARRFDFDAYGEPAFVKLANNALGAYNALATAAMLDTAAEHGIDPDRFLDIVNVSSGHSWMSEHFHAFPQDLLFKDVALLHQDLPDLPALDLTPHQAGEPLILATRERLHTTRRHADTTTPNPT